MPKLKFHQCSLEFDLRSSQRGDIGRGAQAPFHRTAAGNRNNLVFSYRVLGFVTWVLTLNVSLKGYARTLTERMTIKLL